jgi:hypothetical protein
MTPRERVEAALYGKELDKVPFTSYRCFLPQCYAERTLRNQGLCLLPVGPDPGGTRTITPNCPTETLRYGDPASGHTMVRVTIHTPKGDLVSRSTDLGFTTWTHERMFKGPEDYAKVLAFVDDMRFEMNSEFTDDKLALLVDDFFIMPWVGFSPLLDLINTWMRIETFAVEWAERRDEMMRLYAALLERDRRMFRVLAESSLPVVDYCGNISPQIVGRERCRDLVFPVYEEMAEVLHRSGKLLAVHLDADCGPIAKLVADSPIDIVEAFTPAPDTDMTVAEARKAWPEKVLWVNFPSSLHLASQEVIYETTRRIIAENGSTRKLLIGITEDMPPDRWQQNMLTISEAIADSGSGATPTRTRG